MKKLYLALTCLFIVGLLFAGFGCAKEEAPPAPAPAPAPTPAPEKPKETAADFYKGKDITWVIPWSPGGGFDTWARLIAPYLEKNIGATVIVRNMPGAGGVVALNYVYGVAKPDGLTLCIVDTADMLMRELIGKKEKYDMAKFNWLARITYDSHQVSVGKDCPYQSLDDIRTAPVVKFGCTDRTGATAFAPVALGVALDLKNLKEVSGYPGAAEMRLAVVRGELDFCGGSIPSALPLIKSGDLVPIVTFAPEKHKYIPEVPTIYEAVPDMSPEAKKLVDTLVTVTQSGRGIVLGPGVPEDRVQFLTDAFAKSLNVPELAIKAQKMGRGDVLYLLGNEYYSMIMKAVTLTPEEKDKVSFAILEKY